MDGNPNRRFTSTIRHSSAAFWGAAVLVELTRLEECQRLIIEQKLELEREIEAGLVWVGTPQRPAVPRPVPAEAYRKDGVSHVHQQNTDCHFLLIAIRHILRILDRRREDDPRLAAASDAFHERYPGAQDLRDILEHLDEYEAGEGRLQRREKIERTATSLFLAYDSGLDPEGEVHFHFGPGARTVPLKAAGIAAVELANLLDAVEREQEEADG